MSQALYPDPPNASEEVTVLSVKRAIEAQLDALLRVDLFPLPAPDRKLVQRAHTLIDCLLTFLDGAVTSDALAVMEFQRLMEITMRGVVRQQGRENLAAYLRRLAGEVERSDAENAKAARRVKGSG
jgi:hypothetical protein